MNGRVTDAADAADAAGKIEAVRWVCPYYGNCYRVPGRRHGWGPRPWRHGYGYHRPWRHHYGYGYGWGGGPHWRHYW